MSRTDVARRYASAMFDLASERGTLLAVRASCERLVAVLAATPEAADLLANRTVALAQRRALLTKVIEAAGLETTVGNLAKLLLDRGRIAALPAIVSELGARIDAASGMVKAEVVSALPLGDGQAARLGLALGKRLGRTIELSTRVDPTLIGGLRIEVGQLIFDASVRNHLDRLKERLDSRHIG